MENFGDILPDVLTGVGAMQEVAEKLSELFKESSYTSFNDLRDDVLLRLGKGYTPTTETIRQMHTPGGKASQTPDPVVLAVICGLYQKPVAYVSPEVARILRTLQRNRCIDLRELPSTWDCVTGPQGSLPFDDDDLSEVIDLREHGLAQIDEIEPVAPYAKVS